MRSSWTPRILLALGAAMAPERGTPAAAAEAAWSSRVWQADGLPEKTINGLAQSADGFLWATTPRHLSRFDGVRFEPFALAPGLSAGFRGLLSGRGGALWVSLADGGVLRFQDGQRRIYQVGLPRQPPETLAEDAEGALWINYYGGPVVRLKDGEASVLSAAHGLAAGAGAALAADDEGRIWLAQLGQVGRFEGGRFRVLVRLPSTSTRLAASRAGGVWVGSGNRLYHCDALGRLEAHGVLPGEYPSARVLVLLEGRDGAVWIGTRHDGLFRYAAGRMENVPASHSTVRALLEDREGNLWIGTGGGGLNRVQRRTVEIEGSGTGLASRVVQSIAEDVDGALWGATANGLLVRRAGGTDPAWQPVRLPTPRADPVTCVAADPGGGLWLGTRSRHLHHWRQGRLRTWGPEQGLAAHTVCALAVTRAGELWVAGEGPQALQRLRAGRLETVALPAGVGYLRSLAEDARGHLWVGGSSAPLRFSGGPGLEAVPALGAVTKAVRSLHGTADGSLWIGYQGGGLGRLKDARLATVGPEQGLPGTTVAQVIGDGRGWMWLAMDEGIFKVREAQLHDVLEGRASRLDAVDAGAAAGSFTLATTTCGATEAIRTRAGTLWMPLGTALAVVHPERLAEGGQPPRAVLQRLSVDGRPRAVYGGPVGVAGEPGAVHDLARGGVLRIEPGAGKLEIDFTAPALRAPESVRFQYRLDGLDEAGRWTDAGPQRRATFAHLPPGDYAFRVAACVGERCGEAATALGLTMMPAAWQTWWFRLAALAAFTGAVALVVRRASFRRLRSSLRALEWRERLQRERARIARDIHDDVGNRLTTITLLSGLAQREITDPEKAAGHVREISAAARQVTDALDEIVWAVNPGNDLVPQVVGYLGQFAAELARTAGLRARLDLPARPPARAVSAEVRHGLFLAVKEALNNVVRHAEAREVAMSIDVAGDWLHLEVADDGRGFEAPPLNGTGHGLANIRHRILEVGGRLELESAPGRGTRLALHVPLSAGEGA
jgi:signal transduction histidine kinase/ligand-binding sensor domain-containing protein